jgi:hypothetical protein
MGPPPLCLDRRSLSCCQTAIASRRLRASALRQFLGTFCSEQSATREIEHTARPNLASDPFSYFGGIVIILLIVLILLFGFGGYRLGPGMGYYGGGGISLILLIILVLLLLRVI